jgi:hypothetical protein
MKKNLTFLTGIVLLITVLVAGGFSPAGDDDSSKASKTVIIYLKAIEKEDGGGKYLEMSDSNDNSPVADSLHSADVEPGTKVIWKLADDSGIKKVKKIGPKNKGDVITKNARRFLFLFGNKKLKIPDTAPWDTTEKYDIEFKDTDGKVWHRDPYLRIPPQSDPPG